MTLVNLDSDSYHLAYHCIFIRNINLSRLFFHNYRRLDVRSVRINIISRWHFFFFLLNKIQQNQQAKIANHYYGFCFLNMGALTTALVSVQASL
jgi:hypothetical protein